MCRTNYSTWNADVATKPLNAGGNAAEPQGRHASAMTSKYAQPMKQELESRMDTCASRRSPT